MRGAAVRGRVHHPRRDGGRLGELVDGRGLLNHIMGNRRELPIALGTQLHPLDGRCAIARQRKHLLPREREFYWSTYHLRGHDSENHVWVGGNLGAECATDIIRDDAHPFRRQFEGPGHGISGRVRALVGIVEGDAVLVPHSNRRVGFERIGVLGWCRIDVVERDGSLCKRGLDITANRVALVERIDDLRFVEICTIRAQLDIMWLLFIPDHDEFSSLPRHLQGLGDDGRHELTAVRDGLGLEYGQFGIVNRCKLWGILVREHGDDTGQRTRGTRVDRHDSAPGDRAQHREDIGRSFDRILVGICCRAGDLRNPVETVERRAGRAGYEVIFHRCFSSPVKSSSVRTRVLRASGTLNALPGKGCASVNSASAARPNTSSVAGAPRSTASAFVARQGLSATPPSAMRTSRTTPSVTSSAAATETSAKA